MKPPPPPPHEYASTTPRPAAAATAASMALPPRRSTSIAARVASGSTVAAAPPVPTAVGCLAGVPCPSAGPAAGARNRRPAATTARGRRRMSASYPSRAARTPPRFALGAHERHHRVEDVLLVQRGVERGRRRVLPAHQADERRMA